MVYLHIHTNSWINIYIYKDYICISPCRHVTLERWLGRMVPRGRCKFHFHCGRPKPKRSRGWMLNLPFLRPFHFNVVTYVDCSFHVTGKVLPYVGGTCYATRRVLSYVEGTCYVTRRVLSYVVRTCYVTITLLGGCWLI
jgi:hypothetical protein